MTESAPVWGSDLIEPPQLELLGITMKNNQPVTTVEYVLKETDSIVSKTDLKGVITYVNLDFLRISGFTETELIGASHNIVRHPDMPVEAFADLWASLKANRPWTGIVKNRCKNGDYYWVRANATPIYENGQCIGYMSVRSKPSQEQINAAKSAYLMFREGHAGDMRIKDGVVVKPGLLSKLNLMRNASIKTRMVCALAAMSMLMLAIGGMGLLGMSTTKDALRITYENSVIPSSQLSDIQKLLLTNRLRIAVSLVTPTPEIIKKNTEEVEHNIAEISKIWDAYSANPNFTAEDRILVNKFAEDRKKFVTEGLKPAIAALRANDIALANKIVVEKVRAFYEPVGEDIHKLMTMQNEDARQYYHDAANHYTSVRNQAITLIVIGALLALWAVLTLVSGVLRPMQKVIDLLRNVAQGKYDNDLVVGRHDELGTLMDNIKAMQIRLGFDRADSQRIASGSGWITYPPA